jgi:hypothetical protein
MGNIIDISVYIPNINFKKNNYFSNLSNLFNNDIGECYNIIKTYSVPNDFTDLENFKSWFLNIWKIKDEILENMSIGYSKDKLIENHKVEPHVKLSNKILIILVSIITLYLILFTKGIYIPFFIVVSYIILYRKSKKN